MKTKVLLSLFVVYFLYACESPSKPDYPKSPAQEENPWSSITLRIKGTVTDATNNSPISSAYITIGAGFGLWIIKHFLTDNKGQYIIEEEGRWHKDWTEGWLLLFVEAEGYKARTVGYGDPNHIRLTEEWQTIDVQLERESTK